MASPASGAVSACANLTPSAPTLADGNVVLASVSQRRRWGGGWRWGWGGWTRARSLRGTAGKQPAFPIERQEIQQSAPPPNNHGEKNPSAPDLPDLGQLLQESLPSRWQDDLDALTGKVSWLWFRILSHQHCSSNQIQQILTGYSVLSTGRGDRDLQYWVSCCLTAPSFCRKTSPEIDAKCHFTLSKHC